MLNTSQDALFYAISCCSCYLLPQIHWTFILAWMYKIFIQHSLQSWEKAINQIMMNIHKEKKTLLSWTISQLHTWVMLAWKLGMKSGGCNSVGTNSRSFRERYLGGAIPICNIWIYDRMVRVGLISCEWSKNLSASRLSLHGIGLHTSHITIACLNNQHPWHASTR